MKLVRNVLRLMNMTENDTWYKADPAWEGMAWVQPSQHKDQHIYKILLVKINEN